MPAALDRLQFAPPPPPGMLRAFGFAILAHLLLMLALGWGVNWKRDPVTLSVEAELWSALPQEAAPRLVEPTPRPPMPVPVPVPVPAPPPVVKAEPPRPEPAPREAEIAIEREKEKQEEARRKQLALEREKKRDAEKQKQLEARRELDVRRKQELEKTKATEDKQKLEAARREKADDKKIEAQRKANLERMMAGATGPATATGTAQRSSGPSASYGGRVAARVKPNIVFTEEISGNPRAEIEVRTSPDGTIIGQRILKSSGVKSWDDAVLKAVIKTEVLPRDTDGRVPSPLIIDFRPKD